MGTERYRDSTLSIDERVEDLLLCMTLEEKVAQLGCIWITDLVDKQGFNSDFARRLVPDGVGEVTRISGWTSLQPNESAALANDLQRWFVEETRLGIPALVHEEGLGGFLARGATVFPQAIGLASTFDPDLVQDVAAVIREQMYAVGARHCLAPVLDVARDPRWGRVEETFGEDPVLVGILGTAYVRGLQGNDLAQGVLATGKHFLGYGLPEGGRNQAPVQLGPRELREVYAEPFAVAIARAELGSVMNSYSSVDGLACAGSRALLTDLLRGELGFEGLLVADYGAVSMLATYHHVAAGKQEAASLALQAGLDLELPETDCYGGALRAALEAGRIEGDMVDRSTRRVLRAKLALGLFERPYVDTATAHRAFETSRQRQLARRAATESVVILRNSGILPLSTAIQRVAVVGPGASDERVLQGDYHYPAHLETWWGKGEGRGGVVTSAEGLSVGSIASPWEPGPYYTDHVTPLAAIRALVGKGTEVLYAQGCEVTGNDESAIGEAVQISASADVSIVVVAGRSGIDLSSTVGEARDASNLRLTGMQEALLAAVAATGTPIVVVVLSGRVHDLTAVDELADALLLCWPPGEEGGRAVADVLFGAVEPSGRLPVSLPRSVGQVPRYYGHRHGGSTARFHGAYSDGPVSPLYPFGHGLSYADFLYRHLVVRASDTASPISVSFEVTNISERSGTEVTQLYVSDLVARVVRPEQQLVGFSRVPLGPGQTRRVCFEVDPSRLAYFDDDMRRVTDPGELCLAVGSSSAALHLSAVVSLSGDTVEYPISDIRPTTVTIESWHDAVPDVPKALAP